MGECHKDIEIIQIKHSSKPAPTDTSGNKEPMGSAQQILSSEEKEGYQRTSQKLYSYEMSLEVEKMPTPPHEPRILAPNTCINKVQGVITELSTPLKGESNGFFV